MEHERLWWITWTTFSRWTCRLDRSASLTTGVKMMRQAWPSAWKSLNWTVPCASSTRTSTWLRCRRGCMISPGRVWTRPVASALPTQQTAQKWTRSTWWSSSVRASAATPSSKTSNAATWFSARISCCTASLPSTTKPSYSNSWINGRHITSALKAR